MSSEKPILFIRNAAAKIKAVAKRHKFKIERDVVMPKLRRAEIYLRYGDGIFTRYVHVYAFTDDGYNAKVVICVLGGKTFQKKLRVSDHRITMSALERFLEDKLGLIRKEFDEQIKNEEKGREIVHKILGKLPDDIRSKFFETTHLGQYVAHAVIREYSGESVYSVEITLTYQNGLRFDITVNGIDADTKLTKTILTIVSDITKTIKSGG